MFLIRYDCIDSIPTYGHLWLILKVKSFRRMWQIEFYESGYGRRLVSSTIYWMDIISRKFVVKIVMFVWKDDNKWKRFLGWPISLKNSHYCHWSSKPSSSEGTAQEIIIQMTLRIKLLRWKKSILATQNFNNFKI